MACDLIHAEKKPSDFQLVVTIKIKLIQKWSGITFQSIWVESEDIWINLNLA